MIFVVVNSSLYYLSMFINNNIIEIIFACLSISVTLFCHTSNYKYHNPSYYIIYLLVKTIKMSLLYYIRNQKPTNYCKYSAVRGFKAQLKIVLLRVGGIVCISYASNIIYSIYPGPGSLLYSSH